MPVAGRSPDQPRALDRFGATGIATANEKDSIGSAHVDRYAGTRKQVGVSTADRIH